MARRNIPTRIDPRSFPGPYPTTPGPNNPLKRFSRTTIEVQGLNTLIEHWYTVAALTHEYAPVIVDFYSDVVIHNARQYVRKRTWATHDSINKEPGVVESAMGDFSAWIGPTTFYSPFLEWGTVKMYPRPFMVPAIDMAEPDFIRAFVQVAKFADQLAPLPQGLSRDPRSKGFLQRFRAGLYTTSKALGDVMVFGGREVLRPIRSFAIEGARLLGDVNAVMNGALGARLVTRLRGRATGRLQGFGSATLEHSKTYSAFPGGAAGRRVYNRTVGRQTRGLVTGRLGFGP